LSLIDGDFLEEIGLDKVVRKSENHSVFVLSSTVIHYYGKFFACFILLHGAEPFKLLDLH
jgi:hypothetical protein